MAYLDGVRVGRALGRVDELIGKALRNRLDVPERRFTSLRDTSDKLFAAYSQQTLTPMVRRATAWFTRRRGETSTACRRTVP